MLHFLADILSRTELYTSEIVWLKARRTYYQTYSSLSILSLRWELVPGDHGWDPNPERMNKVRLLHVHCSIAKSITKLDAGFCRHTWPCIRFFQYHEDCLSRYQRDRFIFFCHGSWLYIYQAYRLMAQFETVANFVRCSMSLIVELVHQGLYILIPNGLTIVQIMAHESHYLRIEPFSADHFSASRTPTPGGLVLTLPPKIDLNHKAPPFKMAFTYENRPYNAQALFMTS